LSRRGLRKCADPGTSRRSLAVFRDHAEFRTIRCQPAFSPFARNENVRRGPVVANLPLWNWVFRRVRLLVAVWFFVSFLSFVLYSRRLNDPRRCRNVGSAAMRGSGVPHLELFRLRGAVRWHLQNVGFDLARDLVPTQSLTALRSQLPSPLLASPRPRCAVAQGR